MKKRKRISDADNAKRKKGEDGEKHIEEIIKRAIEKTGVKAKIYKNLYLQFDSSYGNYYGATTEIDLVVLTDQFIFVFEVKNEEYSNNTYFNGDYWLLDNNNNDKVPNPVKQNYCHKLVLSEKLEVDREAIITITCLKDIPSDRDKIDSKYKVNNYLFSSHEIIEDKLCMLLISNNNTHKYNVNQVKIKLDGINKNKHLYKNMHIDNLEETKMLRSYQRDTKYKIGYYDVAICPKCGKTMKVIKIDGAKKPNAKRRKRRFVAALECKNKFCKYTEDFGGYGFKINEDYHSHPSKNIENSNIQLSTIEERLGYTMNEKYQKTVLNKITELESEISILKSKNIKLENEIEFINKQINRETERNKTLTEKISNTRKELKKFKKIIGPFYVGKDVNIWKVGR